MTRRQRKSRIREITQELVQKMQEQFPLVELIEVEDRPTGTVAIHIYTPYEDTFAVLDATGTRVVDLSATEEIHVMIVPHHQKKAIHQTA